MRSMLFLAVFLAQLAGPMSAEPALPSVPKLKAAPEAPIGDNLRDCRLRFRTLAQAGELVFEVGSTDIAPHSLPILRPLIAAALDCGHHALEIGGHAADGATETARQELSIARARRLLQILMDAGFERRNGALIGYGGNLPLVDPDTPDVLNRNNRASVKLLADSPAVAASALTGS